MTEYGLITVRETRMGDARFSHLMNPWPEHVLMDPDFAKNHLGEDGMIRFSFDNANAHYEKVGEDDHGNWQCHLLASEYEHIPW